VQLLESFRLFPVPNSLQVSPKKQTGFSRGARIMRETKPHRIFAHELDEPEGSVILSIVLALDKLE